MIPSNVDTNDTFYERIRAGDKPAIDAMILGNLSLVKSRLNLFLKQYRRFRHLFDDLYGEGLLALTEAVNSFAESEADKPTGRIVSAIDYALKNYVDSEIGAGLMSRSTVQRRRSSDDPLPQRLPLDVADPPVELWNGANGRVDRKQVALDSLGPKRRVSRADARQIIRETVADIEPDSDLLHRILECCETGEEKEIVRLRIDGHSDEEIGEQLGISRQTVGRRRETIEERFERMKKARQ
jgi:RNA polymerase sigma factor (sigma-70 family)